MEIFLGLSSKGLKIDYTRFGFYQICVSLVRFTNLGQVPPLALLPSVYAFEPAKKCHYGSISSITKPCKLVHIAAAKAAKDAGVILSCDPNLSLPLWSSAESARKGILSTWEIVDIIKELRGRVKGLKVDVVGTRGARNAFVAGILSQLAANTSLLEDH